MFQLKFSHLQALTTFSLPDAGKENVVRA